MKRRFCGLAAALISMIAVVQGASASTLSGVSSDALSASTNATRAIIAFDQFTGTGNTSIGGTTTDTPPLPYAAPWTLYTWIDYGGTWRYNASGVRARCATSTPLGKLGFAVGSTEHTVAAQVRRSTATYNAGLVLNDAGTTSLIVRLRNNTATTSFLELQINNGGVVTLASVSIPIATTYTLRAESYGTTSAATARVFLNGTLQINHTLSPANAAVVHAAGAVRVGLLCSSDISTNLDVFHVDV